MKQKYFYIFLLYIALMTNTRIFGEKKVLTLKKTKDFSNGYADANAFIYFKNLFGISTFFETGTYSGCSALTFASIFNQVYTVEFSDTLYEEAHKRLLLCTNVCNKKDDSAHFLKQMLPNANGRSFIFLDAHGCGGSSVPGNPILRELIAIKDSGLSDFVIMIDDARGFPLKGEISLSSIYTLLTEINPKFTIASYSDAIIAYENDHITNSKIIQACTDSLFFNEEIHNTEKVLMAEKIIAQAQGEEKEAILRLTFPESGLYHIWRGLIYMQHQDYRTAEHLFLMAIQKGYNHQRIFSYLQAVQNNQNYFK